jgi:late competence protein required for DNA uptake (superfamily II DNA/RNA helicase)
MYCPCCGRHGVVWDARCSCFECFACGAFARVSDEEALAITLGRAKPVLYALQWRTTCCTIVEGHHE